jgi:hypothetical protein
MRRAKKARSLRVFFCETHQHRSRSAMMGFGKMRKERTHFASTCYVLISLKVSLNQAAVANVEASSLA